MTKKRPARSKAHLTPGDSPGAKCDYIAEDIRGLAVPVEDLKLDERNARTHDERNVAAIAASLKQFGQLKPIVVNAKTGIIEAGNGTLLAARILGWTHLAAVRVDHDPATATGFSIADNRTAELAGWDQALLDELLAGFDPSLAELSEALLLNELRGCFNGIQDTEMARLPDGDRAPFQQMAFTLSDAQAQDVKRALVAAKKAGPFVGTGNQNSNGTAGTVGPGAVAVAGLGGDPIIFRTSDRNDGRVGFDSSQFAHASRQRCRLGRNCRSGNRPGRVVRAQPVTFVHWQPPRAPTTSSSGPGR